MVHASGPLLKTLFGWDPVYVGLIVAANALIILVIELARSALDPRRPPWALAMFRWNTNWIGDPLGLAMAAGGIAAFYQQAVPHNESAVTAMWINWVAAAFAVCLSALFILDEERRKSYRGSDRVNVNRLYHTLFFTLMVFILAGALLRVVMAAATGFDGGALALVPAFGGFGIWVLTFVLDGMKIENPMWRAVRRHYPVRTRVT